MKKNTKTLSRTLLLSIAAVAVSINLYCNDCKAGQTQPAVYSSTSAYIRVTVTAPEQAMQDAINKSYALMAKSESVLRRSIDKDGNQRNRIRNTKFFTGKLDTTIAKLRKNLQITAVPGTNLIRISLTSTEGLERAEITNAVADAIISETAHQQRLRTTSHIENIRTVLNMILGSVAARQKTISRFCGESEVPLMKGRSAIMQGTLATLAKSLTLLRLQKAQARADYDTLQEQKKNTTLATSHKIQAEVTKDPGVAELRAALLKIKITALGDKNNKQLADIRNGLEKMLATRQKTATNRAIQRKLSKLEAEVTSASERLLSVGCQYQEESSRLRDMGVVLEKIARLESEINRLEKQADELNTKIINLRISMGTPHLTLQARAEIN